MTIAAFLETHAPVYLHIFVRVSGIFVLAPILTNPEIPARIRGYASAAIALVVYPVAAPWVPAVPVNTVAFLVQLLDDALIGITIGLFVHVYMTAFLMAGEFYSIQLGFGIVNVLDPLSQTPIPILGQLKALLATIVFVLVNGHHMLFEAVVWSFRTVPGITLNAAQPMVASLVVAFREMFLISFQLAAPVMGTVFLVELVMGILSKVAPQMNIMVAGFQIKIVVGLLVLLPTVTVVVTVAERIFDRSFQLLASVMLAVGS